MTNSRSHFLLPALPLLLVLALSCTGGGGGGPIDDLCESYCEKISDCLDGFDDAEDLCIDQCLADFEEAEELDGDACVDAQFATFECVEKENCDNVFFFLDLDDLEVDGGFLTFCEDEVDAAILACPDSIEL